MYGGAVYIYSGICDITQSYFEENTVGFGTDKANTIQALTPNTVQLNVSYSIFFQDDDYNNIIRIEADENESTAYADYNYWGGNSRGFANIYGVNMTNWIIIDASRDLNTVNAGDVVEITVKFKSTNSDANIQEPAKSVHELTLNLNGKLGNLSPQNITLINNSAKTSYYANNQGSEAINFTTNYARHFVYSFTIYGADKLDANPIITVNPSKSSTTISLTLPADITGNVNINVNGNDNILPVTSPELTLANLDAGEYTVTVSYNGDSKYKGFVNRTVFTIDRQVPLITVNAYDIQFGEDAIINVALNGGGDGDVVITVNNKTYRVKLNQSVTISALAPGNYLIQVTYMGDDNYYLGSLNTTFNVYDNVFITTIYVSANGSDVNGNGSELNPYQTISKALDRNRQLGGGKTIIVAKGEYVLNAYSISDSVNITSYDGALIYSDANTYHLYIGGDVSVYLSGLTFTDGNGVSAGSIAMGSSNNNSAKNLTITNCSFIGNTGPVGAIISYANTLITKTRFISNTATGNSSSVQGIINVRDNSLDISYSTFIANTGMLVYSAVEGNVDNNFWGDNSKITGENISDTLKFTSWIVALASVNDTEVVLRNNYTVSVEFKSTDDGILFNSLDDWMPETEFNLKTLHGNLNTTKVTVVNNTSKVNYIAYTLASEEITVNLANELITVLIFEVEIPEEDKIYVSLNGDDSNNASKNSPLKTLKEALNINTKLGGNKTIILVGTVLNEDNILIDSDVTIISQNTSKITANITVNANVGIQNLLFENTFITHQTGVLTVYTTNFTNTKINSLKDKLSVYDSYFKSGEIISSSVITVNNSTFDQTTLKITGNADLANSKFTLLNADSANINITSSEFTFDVNITNSTAVIKNNRFGDLNIYTSKAAVENSTISTLLTNSQISLKGNTINLIDFKGGSVDNIVLTFLDGRTYKVNGADANVNVSVCDDMGNIINGGEITFTANGAQIAKASVVNGTAIINVSLSQGDYIISGSSSDFKVAKITTGVLRVDVASYWFIDDAGYETLADAVNASKNGDVIKGLPGIYYIDEIDIGHRYRSGEPWTVIKNITITSTSQKPVTLKGNGDRLFFVDTGSGLTLINLILTESRKESNYGGIINTMTNTTLTIINSTLVNATADSGGAVYAFGAVKIINSRFINNTAGLTGGAIFKDGAGNLEIEDSQFINNYASSYGGAVHFAGDWDTDNYIKNSRFINNTAFRGGALYAGGGNLTVIKSDFISNKALRILEDYEDDDAVGGAFYNYYANVEFYDSNFINNYAEDCGGAMELDNTVTSIGSYYNPTITIYFTGIDNCTFSNNTADDGGAIYMGLAGTPFVLISNSRFDSNTANYDSAAIGNICGFLSIENCEFTNNTAVSGDNLIYIYGLDDIYNEYDAYLFIDNSTFKNNNVALDIYVANAYSYAEIYNSTFTGEETVLSNRGFTNITNTVIKDSVNASKYVINNFGLLGLSNNTFDNPLYSDFYIHTPTQVVILDNKTVSAAVGSTYLLTALVLDDNGNRIEGCDLIFLADGHEINASLKNHIFQADYLVSDGEHIISANYTDTGLENLSVKTGIIIGKNGTAMTVNTTTIAEGEIEIITVTLPHDATGTVEATVNGKTYVASVNDGIAIISIPNLVKGIHQVTVKYNGDDIYAPLQQSTAVLVEDAYNTRLIVSDMEKYYHGPERLIIQLVDLENNPLSSQTIYITINGQMYRRVTNESGMAGMNINLNSGIYPVSISYGGALNLDPVQKNITVTVKQSVNANDVVKIFRNQTQYYAVFVDFNGNPLAHGSEVKFNINGVIYSRYINGSEGRARLNLNLEQGEYILTAINPITGENYANTIKILPKITENSDLVKYYRNASQYVVKIVGDDGQAVGANVSVTFNINGVFYTRYTNVSGDVKLNINLQPGEYIITAEYGGCRVSNKISVIPVLSARDLNMHYRDGSQFETKLIDGTGNVLKGVNVTFNINGVFYNRITDGDGIAHLNINLMAGEYIITSSYNGANIANKVTIS